MADKNRVRVRKNKVGKPLKLSAAEIEAIAYDYVNSNELPEVIAKKHRLPTQTYHNLKRTKRFRRAIEILKEN